MSTGTADRVFAYGNPGDTVLVGDWNGDRKDTLAVRRGNTYFLKNSLNSGQADTVFAYGNPTDTVLVGDWNGDRRTTIGVRRVAAAAEGAGTISQQNALRTAKEYLEYSAFSRLGLIGQLEYEKYSTQDATWAVDRVSVNWNEQAARMANEYLRYTSFSRAGLIDQLIYEGFTPKQAEYGVSQTGL
nr:Ltp family lipoprotein [Arthrobacter gengyunqii]